jgi:ketosteroid isomerase-like protein
MPPGNRAVALAFHEADTTAWLEDFIEIGDDRAVVVAHSKGIGRRSGVEIEMHGSEIWSFRDGQVGGITLYRTRQEALQAAGLE